MRTGTGQELGWFPLLGPSDGLFGPRRRKIERRNDQPKNEGSTMVFKGLSVMVAGHVVTVEIDEGSKVGRMVLNRPKDGRKPTQVELEALAFSVVQAMAAGQPGPPRQANQAADQGRTGRLDPGVTNMLKTTWWFEVSVSKYGTPSSGAVKGLYGLGDKVHWVRKGNTRDSFAEAQADAIANGERPYRIKSETREEAFVPAEGSTILVPTGGG